MFVGRTNKSLCLRAILALNQPDGSGLFRENVLLTHPTVAQIICSIVAIATTDARPADLRAGKHVSYCAETLRVLGSTRCFLSMRDPTWLCWRSTGCSCSPWLLCAPQRGLFCCSESGASSPTATNTTGKWNALV